MLNIQNKCTLVTDAGGFDHFGVCDGSIISGFAAKTNPLPAVTLRFENFGFDPSTCPVTVVITTKDKVLTEIIPPNTVAAFTLKNVKEITTQCTNTGVANPCVFSGNMEISNCICCPDNRGSKVTELNSIPVQHSSSARHSGPCDGSVLPVYLAGGDVLPTVTLQFTNSGEFPIILNVERQGPDIIRTVETSSTITLTADDVKSITAQCKSGTGLWAYFASLSINFCMCCPD